MKSDCNIYGLTQNTNYEMLAYDSIGNYLVRTDIGNFKWIPTTYFENGRINRKHLEDSNYFIREELTEYRYFYLPEKWTKANRTNSISNKWSIELKTLTDKIGFAQSLQLHKDELGPYLELLIRNDSLRFDLLSERINQLGRIQYFLSDGYNISLMHLDKIQGRKLTTKELVAIKYRQKLDYKLENFNIEDIRSDQITQTIKDSFRWNYDHLEGFNNCKQLFETEFHKNIYLQIIEDIQEDLITYSKINKCEMHLYKQFDTWGNRFLIFRTKEFNTILELINGIH